VAEFIYSKGSYAYGGYPDVDDLFVQQARERDAKKREALLHRIQQLTMDRDLMHLRDQLSPVVAEMVYYGFWYHAKFDALLAFIRDAQKIVTGDVTLNLYKGNLQVASRTSPNSLYDEGIATMEGGGSYNQTDAEGFLRIQGLPGRVQSRVTPRKY